MQPTLYDHIADTVEGLAKPGTSSLVRRSTKFRTGEAAPVLPEDGRSAVRCAAVRIDNDISSSVLLQIHLDDVDVVAARFV